MEKNAESRSSKRNLCDFCTDEIAVLYCRADSAKLCLSCDQHVHSANSLSSKHLRSQICDNCGSEPVTVRCLTDDLVLCQECDWDAHGSCSVSMSHERDPIEGFFGCPSAIELASIWGFDLEKKKKSSIPTPQMPQVNNFMFPNWNSLDPVMSTVDSWIYKSKAMILQDLTVPGETEVEPMYVNVPCGDRSALSKRQRPSCGKQKQVILQQLLELLKSDSVQVDGGGEGLDPGTPCRSAWQGNVERPELGNGDTDAHQLLRQQTPLTPLLRQQAPHTPLIMASMHMDPRENDRIMGGDILWDYIVNDQGTQIWDFQSGRLRDDENIGYDLNCDAGYMIKNYSDLIRETPPASTKVLEDIYEINCSKSDKSNNPTVSQGLATSESINLPIVRPSLGSTSFLVGDDRARLATTKAEMEMLARNRSNAMLRYKEKKKNRRYDKHIRYESRKARADTRKRLNGRFVKASGAPDFEINS